MPRFTKPRILFGIALLAVGVGVATYARHGLMAVTTEKPAAAAPAAIPVDTVVVAKLAVRVWRTFPARLVAVDEVDLRPQVSGRIDEIRFQDGQTVAKGDVLFVIDPRPFEAAAAAARADLAGAEDRRSFTERELARARKLIRTKAVAERVLDQRANEFATAKSDVEMAAARVVQAEIDLDRAYVKAPIAGRVSRAEVTIGNLVQAGANAPLLTSIVSNNGIYADFEVDENTYLRYVRASAKDAVSERAIPVRLAIGSSGAATHEGRIHSFDNKIDPRTGTIRARAHFTNADGQLLPGMFTRVDMGSATEQDTVLLTERAILTDQNRKYVYVVRPDKKAAYREVVLGATIEGRRVIEKGLDAGEQVIVAGVMVVRPNATVEPKQVSQGPDGKAAHVATGR